MLNHARITSEQTLQHMLVILSELADVTYAPRDTRIKLHSLVVQTKGWLITDTHLLGRRIKLLGLVVWTRCPGHGSDPIRLSALDSLTDFENFKILTVLTK